MLLFRTLEIPTTPAMAKFLCVQALGPIRLIEITLCLQYRTVHRKALIVSDVRVYTRASSLGTQGIHPEKMRPEFCVFSGLSMSIDEFLYSKSTTKLSKIHNPLRYKAILDLRH